MLPKTIGLPPLLAIRHRPNRNVPRSVRTGLCIGRQHVAEPQANELRHCALFAVGAECCGFDPVPLSETAPPRQLRAELRLWRRRQRAERLRRGQTLPEWISYPPPARRSTNRTCARRSTACWTPRVSIAAVHT